MTRDYLIPALVAVAVFLVLAFVATFARAHEAPSGWTYGIECCALNDCQEITPAAVTEGPDGITVILDQTLHKMLISRVTYTLPYGDTRIKDSPDGVFHACIARQYEVAGTMQGGRLICLYVPPKGF